jgi:hypothetical protein
MTALSWREVEFPGMAVAGLVPGYVTALAGLWAESVPGFVAIDLADFWCRYLVVAPHARARRGS